MTSVRFTVEVVRPLITGFPEEVDTVILNVTFEVTEGSAVLVHPVRRLPTRSTTIKNEGFFIPKFIHFDRSTGNRVTKINHHPTSITALRLDDSVGLNQIKYLLLDAFRESRATHSIIV